MIWQPHDLQHVNDSGVSSHGVAQASTREGERLAHRARDDHVRVLSQQLEGRTRARATELSVSLIDYEHRTGSKTSSSNALSVSEVKEGAGRVIRRSQQHNARAKLRNARDRRIDVASEVSATLACAVLSEGVAGVLRIHRIRGVKGDRETTRAAEGQEDVVHDLIRAIGRPGLRSGHGNAGLASDVSRERSTQLIGITIGVAIEGRSNLLDGSSHRRGERRRGPERVLVHVHGRSNIELGRAVALYADQVIADRQGEVAHDYLPPTRIEIASPWPGRSSAPERAITCGATSASACSSYSMR